MSDYYNPVPHSSDKPIPEAVEKNEQKTPKRITTRFKTTGDFKDISKNSNEKSEKNFSR
jgi:hypothetical protein